MRLFFVRKFFAFVPYLRLQNRTRLFYVLYYVENLPFLIFASLSDLPIGMFFIIVEFANRHFANRHYIHQAVINSFTTALHSSTKSSLNLIHMHAAVS